MFGSDRSRPKDRQTSRGRRCKSAVKTKANSTLYGVERRSALKNMLTGPTLLEMSDFAVISGLRKEFSTFVRLGYDLDAADETMI